MESVGYKAAHTALSQFLKKKKVNLKGYRGLTSFVLYIGRIFLSETICQKVNRGLV